MKTTEIGLSASILLDERAVRMTREDIEMATASMVTCLNDLKLCVRLGPANTFKPEGEVKMSLTEFLKWVRDKKTG